MVDILNQMAREYVNHEANALRGYVSEEKLAPIILNIAFLREIECMMHKNLIDTQNLIKGNLNLKDVENSCKIIKKFITKNEVIRGVISDIFLEFINEQSEKLKDIVFVTATDGNHGKGIAWAANKLGCKSVVFMPKDSVLARAKAIESMGNSTVTITDLNYDDAVRKAASLADEKGWYLVQDTAWEGYEDIPNFISQGYTIMAKEALDELNELGIEKPTHLFLQAGVGSMAGSVLGYMVNRFDKKPPITTIVEPATVACIYKSAKANDSKPHAVTGDLHTIMAGLNCGEPNTATWPILRDYASFYASCPDYVTARGMRILASPLKNDKKVISGESGAVGAGLLSMLMEKDEFEDIRHDIGLNKDSVVLIFSTEGNTDPKGYDEIIYDGRNFSPFV